MFFGALILLNALVLGVDIEVGLRNGGDSGPVLYWVQFAFLLLFLFELILRVLAFGCEYFSIRNPAGLFDTLIIGTSVVEYAVGMFVGGSSPLGAVSIMRIFRLVRIARVVRLVSVSSELSLLIHGLVASMQAVFWVFCLLVVIMYICALICTAELGETEDEVLRKHFGSVGSSFWTHFMIVTLEGYPAVANAAAEVSWIWYLYFVGFIIFSNVVLMNLVTGIVCEAIVAKAEDDELESHVYRQESVKFELVLSALLEEQGLEEIGFDEFQGLVRQKMFRAALNTLDICLELEDQELFDILDEHGTGSFSPADFIAALLRLRGSKQSPHALIVQGDVIRGGRLVREAFKNAEAGASEYSASLCGALKDKLLQRVDDLRGMLRDGRLLDELSDRETHHRSYRDLRPEPLHRAGPPSALAAVMAAAAAATSSASCAATSSVSRGSAAVYAPAVSAPASSVGSHDHEGEVGNLTALVASSACSITESPRAAAEPSEESLVPHASTKPTEEPLASPDAAASAKPTEESPASQGAAASAKPTEESPGSEGAAASAKPTEESPASRYIAASAKPTEESPASRDAAELTEESPAPRATEPTEESPTLATNTSIEEPSSSSGQGGDTKARVCGLLTLLETSSSEARAALTRLRDELSASRCRVEALEARVARRRESAQREERVVEPVRARELQLAPGPSSETTSHAAVHPSLAATHRAAPAGELGRAVGAWRSNAQRREPAATPPDAADGAGVASEERGHDLANEELAHEALANAELANEGVTEAESSKVFESPKVADCESEEEAVRSGRPRSECMAHRRRLEEKYNADLCPKLSPAPAPGRRRGGAPRQRYLGAFHGHSPDAQSVAKAATHGSSDEEMCGG